jgi:hypothetical protein
MTKLRKVRLVGYVACICTGEKIQNFVLKSEGKIPLGILKETQLNNIKMYLGQYYVVI